MIRYAFITVTDYQFFPGTLATVNSIAHFQPQAEIFVVYNEKQPLSEPQARMLSGNPRMHLLGSSFFEKPGRYINAWELKAYAANDLAAEFDVIVGIDSDCLLCSNVDAEIQHCFNSGGFLWGKDGDGASYDDSYRIYGIATPSHNPRYMSTSLYFCAVTNANLKILRRWAEYCLQAVFNGQGPYPGHGDQGVLNAVLYAEEATTRVELLENPLWSQHWTYWDSIIGFRDGEFLNVSAGRTQRSFHCGGAEKYWEKQHSSRVLTQNSLQTYPYVWFLAMFFFGEFRNWNIDPLQYLPPASHHLVEDMVQFLPQIQQILQRARPMWNGLTDQIIDRVLNGIPRCLSLGGGGMSEVIHLVASNPKVRRYVEIGSYEGGSILALGLRFANRDIDFYSVESFMGNMDGTMDGHRLPSRTKFQNNLGRFVSLRVKLIPGELGASRLSI